MLIYQLSQVVYMSSKFELFQAEKKKMFAKVRNIWFLSPLILSN